MRQPEGLPCTEQAASAPRISARMDLREGEGFIRFTILDLRFSIVFANYSNHFAVVAKHRLEAKGVNEYNVIIKAERLLPPRERSPIVATCPHLC